jgi:flagellar biosynthetic protein FliQ
VGFDMAISMVRQGVFQVLMLSAPALLVSMAVGLVIAVLQATTSIQEQTITFVPKLAAILGVLVLFGPWMLSTLIEYTKQIFALIPNMAG